MNQIVPQQPAAQVPAHLAHLYAAPAQFNLGASIAAGIGMGAHNRISIKQARWRLMDTQGGETVVNSFTLDVLLVDANAFTSKTFYEGAYDPAAADNIAPRCWSDNGHAPSERVSNPCAYTCAACPNNAFGSKITPAGKKAKACTDSKRLAVVLADNPDGLIYELRIPAASLTNMAAAINDIDKRGVRAEHIVWRLEFDPNAEYPKINWAPASFVNEVQLAAVNRLMGSKETAELVNKDDKPIEASRQLGAPATAPAQPPVPQGGAQLAAPNYAQQAAAPVPQFQAPQAPVPQQQQPQMYGQHLAVPAAAPVTSAPFVAPTAGIASPFNPGQMPPAQQQQPNPLGLNMAPLPQQAPAVPIQAQALPEKPKRTRKPKEAPAMPAAAVQQQPAMAFAPPQQPMASPFAAAVGQPVAAPQVNAYVPPPQAANLDVAHAMPPAQAVPVHPQPTNQGLDNLLAGINFG